jgi:hypothetical protein
VSWAASRRAPQGLSCAALRLWKDRRRDTIRETSDLLGDVSQKSSALTIVDGLEVNAVGRFLEHEWWIDAEELAWFKEATL